MVTTGSGTIFGDIPDLISHLEMVYRDNQANASSEDNKFISWAKSYLNQHRPYEVFAIDGNYGIRLTNGIRIKVCPDAQDKPRSGDMANPDTSISITKTR